jgi:hypothetical protein
MNSASIMIGFCAIGFAFMGLAAIFAPRRVTEQFDIPVLTKAGRNEVRAVYGGFGLVMAGMLVVALMQLDLRAGICLTLSGALAGMAGGRILSALIDRGIDRFPGLYLCIELIGAGLLLYAAGIRQA